jgi:hypothetical protein
MLLPIHTPHLLIVKQALVRGSQAIIARVRSVLETKIVK